MSPENQPTPSGESDEKRYNEIADTPLTEDGLKDLEAVYKIGNIVPHKELKESPVRVQLGQNGEYLYDEGELLLNISDEQHNKGMEEMGGILDQIEADAPEAIKNLKDEGRAAEIARASIARIQKSSE